MVRKKKVADEVSGTGEQVTSTYPSDLVSGSTANVNYEFPESNAVDAEEITIKAESINEVSESTLLSLLKEAPAVPFLTNQQDTNKFVDEYARWKRKVEAAIGV